MRNKGFTLIEILVALFIFTILSAMLVGALHQVIGSQEGAEANADRLRRLQFALLLMSRDVQQAVNRPVLNESAKEEQAFIGTPQGFTLTHMGFANSMGTATRSTLERTGYRFNKQGLLRLSWSALDQAPKARSHARILLDDVTDAQFYYLDKAKRFRQTWPIRDQHDQPLPRAVKVILTMAKWGKIEQIFIIPVQVHDAAKPEPKKA